MTSKEGKDIKKSSERFTSLNILILLGLLIRFAISFVTETDDLRVWRCISIYAYVYGLDIFSIYRGYGPMIDATYLVVYPIYLVISLIFPSPHIERLILKLPMILSDILIGVILYRLIRKFGDERQAKVIAGLWILNPYVIWISSIWGMFDSLPTLFTLFAMERFLSKHYKSSAILLSISIGYKLYSILIVPWFLFAIYKEGKEQTLTYIEYFLVSIAILILPWKIVLSDFTTSLQGATRELIAPSLSYFPVFIAWHPTLADNWTYISGGIILSLSMVYMYYHRNRPNSLENLNNEILFGILLIFLGPHRYIYPAHLIWALPFLLIASLYARKLPISLTIFLMITPVLWILNWNVIKWFTLGALQAYDTYWPLYNIPFNFAYGVNFSLLCLLCAMYLVQAKKVSFMGYKPKFWFIGKLGREKSLTNIVRTLGLYLPIIFVLILYITDWIHVRVWKSYYRVFSNFIRTMPLFLPIIGVLLVFLIYIPFLLEMIFRGSISFRNTMKKVNTVKKKAIPVLLATIWVYCVFFHFPLL